MEYGQRCNPAGTGQAFPGPGAHCDLYRRDVFECSEGMKFIAVPPLTLNTCFEFDPGFERALRDYQQQQSFT